MKYKLLLSIAFAGVAASSFADHNWHLSSNYDFELNGNWGRDVTHIVANMSGHAVDNSYGWGSSAWAFSTSWTSHVELTFDTYWFNLNAAEPVLDESLFIGIVQDLPNDPPGQEHVVFFMDNDAANNVENIAWGTVFNNITEETVLGALHDGIDGATQEIRDAGMDAVFDFLNNDCRDARVGPNGTQGSLWFGAGEDFSIMAFSDGTRGGDGTSEWSTEFQAVPEPASVSVVAGACLMLAFRRRKR